MLAYKYYSSCEIKFSKEDDEDYLVAEAVNFIEPTGIHFYSIYSGLKLVDSMSPFFKTNPIENTIYKKERNYNDNWSLNLNESKLSQKEYLIYLDRTILNNPTNEYTKNLNLADLSKKFFKTFTVNNTSSTPVYQANSGIIAFIPIKSGNTQSAFSPIMDDKLPLTISDGSSLVVKFVAKIPFGMSLKVEADISKYKNNFTFLNLISDIFKPSSLSYTAGFVGQNGKLTSEIQGTNTWTEYTYIIRNSSKSVIAYLRNLLFYVGYSNNPEAIDVRSNIAKYSYFAYMDVFLLDNRCSYLWGYCPFENVTTIKNSIIYNQNFIETADNVATEANVSAHDIVLKKEK